MTENIDRRQYAALAAAQPKKRKYRNQPVEVDGIRFDSKAEAKRYGQLKQMQAAGLISELRLQTQFPLKINGVAVASYRADFDYLDAEKRLVIEDVKGVATPVFKLKAKLFQAIYGRPITIITTR